MSDAAKIGTPGRSGFFKLQPVHVDLGDVLVQVLAVALGVIVGFGVTQWTERAHQRELLRGTIANIAAELRANQAGMRVVLREHARTATALAAFAQRAERTRQVTFTQGRAVLAGSVFRTNIPLAIAWQIAQNDQGLALLPYQDRYDLAWVYQMQSVYYDAERRYQNSVLTLAEPPDGNYYIDVVDLAAQERAVVAAERQLDVLYTAAVARASAVD